MSVNFNRSKGKNILNSREYKHKVVIDLEPYWDEGWSYYPKWKPTHSKPKKRLLYYQVRMYRTWKHNRKTQYKQF